MTAVKTIMKNRCLLHQNSSLYECYFTGYVKVVTK